MISNIDGRIMSFSKEPFPKNLESDANGVIDADAAFHQAEIIRGWVESLLDRKGYRHQVEYNTSVEKAEKIGMAWVLTLRKTLPGGKHNYWWQETFDALVVASGHYSIPRFSEVQGLAEFAENHPGVVEHSKIYRGPERYRGKVELMSPGKKTWLIVCRPLSQSEHQFQQQISADKWQRLQSLQSMPQYDSPIVYMALSHSNIPR